jgi:hypothetical protein
MSKHGAIKVTPLELLYGQEVVLPMEINLQTYGVMHQDALLVVEYKTIMMDEIEDIPEN